MVSVADVVQFVDRIDVNPTVRLDLNDEDAFTIESFEAPPPQVRRSMVSNAMTSGGYVGASTYDVRVITITVLLRTDTQDDNAAAIQALARELDRDTNLLRYQPNGLSKPVFFKTWRSSIADVEDIMVSAAQRRLTIDLVAEPFALGAREDLGPVTIYWNPTVANGVRATLGTVIGDVPSPLLMVLSSTLTDGLLIATTRTQAPTVYYRQLESETASTDTSNPGGAADSAMSGSGTTNYLRTTFATTATEAIRVRVDNLPDAGGSYRVLVAVRSATAATHNFGIRMDGGSTVIKGGITAARQVIDLGVRTFQSFRFGELAAVNEPSTPTSVQSMYLYAERISGSTSLDWDCVIFVPVDEQACVLDYVSGGNAAALDGYSETFVEYLTGDPEAGTATDARTYQVAGSFPYVTPGRTNYLYAMPVATGTTALVGSSQQFGTVAYWPRYLHVRPLSS